MEIFISWSRERSEAVARSLYEWLPLVIQSSKPWLSREIEKGSRWDDVISETLERCSFGIICLTPESTSSDWILFEAGALSKKVREARVCTYLFDLPPSDVGGPLAKFQHTRADREDTWRLVETINRHSAQPLDSDRLKQTFHTWWPKLEEMLTRIGPASAPTSSGRTDREKLDEILLEVRELRRITQPDPQRAYLESLMRGEAPPLVTANFEPYLGAAIHQWREDQKYVASAVLNEPPKRLDHRGLRCATHLLSARVSGPVEGGGYRVDACCDAFLQEAVNILLTQRAREDARKPKE